jgi:hypothetical protein
MLNYTQLKTVTCTYALWKRLSSDPCKSVWGCASLLLQAPCSQQILKLIWPGIDPKSTGAQRHRRTMHNSCGKKMPIMNRCGLCKPSDLTIIYIYIYIYTGCARQCVSSEEGLGGIMPHHHLSNHHWAIIHHWASIHHWSLIYHSMIIPKFITDSE